MSDDDRRRVISRRRARYAVVCSRPRPLSVMPPSLFTYSSSSVRSPLVHFPATTIGIAACRSAGGIIRFDVFLPASRDREDNQLTSAAASSLSPCSLKPPVFDFPCLL